jgi:hypothetical protein
MIFSRFFDLYIFFKNHFLVVILIKQVFTFLKNSFHSNTENHNQKIYNNIVCVHNEIHSLFFYSLLTLQVVGKLMKIINLRKIESLKSKRRQQIEKNAVLIIYQLIHNNNIISYK